MNVKMEDVVERIVLEETLATTIDEHDGLRMRTCVLRNLVRLRLELKDQFARNHRGHITDACTERYCSREEEFK